MKKAFGNYGNQFANDLAKQRKIKKQFFIDGEWMDEPEGRARDVRYKCNRAFGLTSRAWQYIDSEKKEAPKRVENILERLYSSAEDDGRIVLFSPWGPRYSYKMNGTTIGSDDKETRTMDRVAGILQELQKIGFDPRILLMYADLYGTEINGLPESIVKDYEGSLRERSESVLGEPLYFDTWSAIRNRSYKKYKGLRASISADIESYVKPGILNNILRKSPPGSTEKSTKRYAVERLAEGIIIDYAYKPIKLSLVSREKDVLDGPLPRVYLIPQDLRSPWMG